MGCPCFLCYDGSPVSTMWVWNTNTATHVMLMDLNSRTAPKHGLGSTDLWQGLTAGASDQVGRWNRCYLKRTPNSKPPIAISMFNPPKRPSRRYSQNRKAITAKGKRDQRFLAKRKRPGSRFISTTVPVTRSKLGWDLLELHHSAWMERSAAP